MEPKDDDLAGLRRIFAELGESQQRVARILLDDAASAVFLSAHELADRAGVHASTVVRLSQRLGFAGYPDLQADLRRKLSAYPGFFRLLETEAAAADPHDVLTHVFAVARRNMERASRTLDEHELRRVIGALDSCRRVVVLGMGVARPVVTYLASCLRLAGLDAHEPADPITMAQELATTGGDDVVVVIDFHRYYREIAQLAAIASETGATVVTISDSAASEIAGTAHHLLSVPSEGAAPRTSLAPAMVLVEAMLAELTATRKEEAQRTMRNTDDIFRRAGTFGRST